MKSARFILLFLPLWMSQSVVSLQPQPHLVIYGLGNVGRAVAEEVPRDWLVRGTTRRDCADCLSIPFESASTYLPEASHVLVTIPPTPEVSTQILADLRAHLPSSGSWVGFVSTSGVYGNHDGAWVQEDSPLLCSSSAIKYVEFERELMDLADARGWNAAIFRCAGLYGPSRSALHTLWKKGPPKNEGSSPDAFVTNRIHEHDVARAVVSAMQKESNGIYNLSDNQPETREVIMEYVAQLLESKGIRVPERQQEELARQSNRGERRKKERKLVDNGKMKANLIDDLLYPTYREGLNAIFEEKSNPWWSLE